MRYREKQRTTINISSHCTRITLENDSLLFTFLLQVFFSGNLRFNSY